MIRAPWVAIDWFGGAGEEAPILDDMVYNALIVCFARSRETVKQAVDLFHWSNEQVWHFVLSSITLSGDGLDPGSPDE